MSDVSALGALSSAGAQRPVAGQKQTELGQEQYLKLMITQFQNQDPFNPMENGDFLGQIAQFGTVSGITELKDSFAAVAASISSDQVLQASGLIGRTVLADVNAGHLDQGGTLVGAVDLPASTSSVTVEVRDTAGQLVRRFDLGPQSGGLAHFTWDGVADDGQFAPSGNYFFSASAQTASGPEAAGVLVAAKVDSVSLSPTSGALSLNFRAMPPLALNQIRQIT